MFIVHDKTKIVNLRETSVSFFLFCKLKPLLPSALGGGLGRPRRSGIPSPEGVRRMTNSYIKVLHFDLESSYELFTPQVQLSSAKLAICLKNSIFGVEKLSFLRGLIFSFRPTLRT